MKKITNVALAIALILAAYLFFYELFGDVEVMMVFATPFVIVTAIGWLVIDRKELNK